MGKRWFGVLSLASLALAGPLAAGAEVLPARVTENVRLGPADAAVRGRQIPALAVNPADPRHVVATDEDFITGNCDHHVSFDGGVTWASGHLTAPAGYPSPPCPVFDRGGYGHSGGTVDFGKGQDVYTAFTANQPGQSGGPARSTDGGDAILVAKSTDGGRTFATAKVAIPPAVNANISDSFRPKLAADGDRIVVVARSCDAVLVPGAVAACYYTTASGSRDGGATWSAPVRINQPTDGQAGGNPFSQPAFTPDGKVHIAYLRTGGAPGRASLVLASSTDTGATWTHSDIGSPAGLTEPKLVGDPRDGTLYLAYQGTPFAGDGDIAFQRRPAGSTSWSPPVRVNDDPLGNGVLQRVPWLNLAPNGRLDVFWHDRRHPYKAENLEDYYFASSTDGGVTFSANRRVTDRTINLSVGLNTRVTGGNWYWPAMASLGNDELLAAWGDSREGNFSTDTEDIYLAHINLVPGDAPPVTPMAVDPDGTALARLAYPGGQEGGGESVAAPGHSVATGGTSGVVVVGAADGPGALAGSVLARGSFGPLLASPVAGLPAEVKAEVTRMQAVGAFVVGDETSLSSQVVQDLIAAGVPKDRVTRIAGQSSAEVAKGAATALDTRTSEQKAAGAPAFAAAVIANPATPEAVAAAGMAASLRFPILYVDRDMVPRATTDALKSLAINKTFVVGGPAAVSDAVATQMPAPKRLGGADAIATSEAVLSESQAQGLPLNVAYVGDPARPVGTALLASAVARLGGLLVLAPGGDSGAADASLARVGVRAFVDRLVVPNIATFAPASAGPGASASGGPSLPATGGQSLLSGGLVALAAGLALRRRHSRPKTGS